MDAAPLMKFKKDEKLYRQNILETGKRVDGRMKILAIMSEHDLRTIHLRDWRSPRRVHGSAVFNRLIFGETQALGKTYRGISTLGTSRDTQDIEAGLTGGAKSQEVLHPSLQLPGRRPLRSRRAKQVVLDSLLGRREIGHGARRRAFSPFAHPYPPEDESIPLMPSA